jgi:hypothetical protein
MVVRRIAAGLALVALLGACTETPSAPAPASGAPARAVLVSNGAVKVGTPPAQAPSAARSPTPATSPPKLSSGRPAVAGQPIDAVAARQLAQAAPAGPAKPGAQTKPAAKKPATTNPAATKVAPVKPGTQVKPADAAKDAAEAEDAPEPTPIPKPTMRPAHIPRREARPVFAPGRTSFVKERGREGVGFYRPGELTPAPHVYAAPRPPDPFADDEDLFEDEPLEEATP